MEITGSFRFSKALAPEVIDLINHLADTPRYARDTTKIGLRYGAEGEFYTEDELESAIKPLRAPASQPSTECNWYASEDGTELLFNDDVPHMMDAEKWLQYLIVRVIQQSDSTLTGEVCFSADEEAVTLRVNQNAISIA